MKNKVTVILLVILVTLLNVTNAGAKQKCHKWQENFAPIPQLADYMAPETDGQHTPVLTAYSDYLSDFNWYFREFPGTCKVNPEPLGKYHKRLH